MTQQVEVKPGFSFTNKVKKEARPKWRTYYYPVLGQDTDGQPLRLPADEWSFNNYLAKGFTIAPMEPELLERLHEEAVARKPVLAGAPTPPPRAAAATVPAPTPQLSPLPSGAGASIALQLALAEADVARLKALAIMEAEAVGQPVEAAVAVAPVAPEVEAPASAEVSVPLTHGDETPQTPGDATLGDLPTNTASNDPAGLTCRVCLFEAKTKAGMSSHMKKHAKE